MFIIALPFTLNVECVLLHEFLFFFFSYVFRRTFIHILFNIISLNFPSSSSSCTRTTLVRIFVCFDIGHYGCHAFTRRVANIIVLPCVCIEFVEVNASFVQPHDQVIRSFRSLQCETKSRAANCSNCHRLLCRLGVRARAPSLMYRLLYIIHTW